MVQGFVLFQHDVAVTQDILNRPTRYFIFILQCTFNERNYRTYKASLGIHVSLDLLKPKINLTFYISRIQ